MAKFNIEIELDWLGEEESIDEALQSQIMASIKDHVTQRATDSINKKLAEFMSKKCGDIEKMFADKVEEFLGNTFCQRIEQMKIPRKKRGSWDSEIEYIPMSEFVGLKYEAFLNMKTLDSKGGTPRYDSDKTMSINEFFVNKYLEKELASKVAALIKTARHDAEETVLKTLEETLRSQLSADIISRLNIPAMLVALQEKAALLEAQEQ